MKTLHLSGLQKIVLQVMETRLHKDQLAETHTLFEQLDVDRTGLIRRHKLAEVLQQQTFLTVSLSRTLTLTLSPDPSPDPDPNPDPNPNPNQVLQQQTRQSGEQDGAGSAGSPKPGRAALSPSVAAR